MRAWQEHQQCQRSRHARVAGARRFPRKLHERAASVRTAASRVSPNGYGGPGPIGYFNGRR